jgi:uncharacterized membrane protein affecting hemolysin expression
MWKDGKYNCDKKSGETIRSSNSIQKVEDGVAINNNLNANQINQQFVTPIRVFHLK